MTDHSRWDALPEPVAFVLGGGATLGALQVGMLRALGEAGIAPQLVVGTSVGALNGAVVAATGDPTEAARQLDDAWRRMTTATVFPGSRFFQAYRVVRGRSAFPDSGLRAVIASMLGTAPRFDALRLPFGAVTTSVASGHPTVFASGDLLGPLLASAAIPGVLPIQTIDGGPYWDGGVASNVPLLAALRMGARSIVVLDPGDICHRSEPPVGIAAITLAAFGTAIPQRVLVEVEQVAAVAPVLYLDRPCVTGREPLSFASSSDLIDEGYAHAAAFLATAQVPVAGALVGTPHTHAHEDQAGGAHEPRFPRGGRAVTH